MPGQRQSVGTAHHEQRAVEHIVRIEDPRRWRIEDVALEDFDGDDKGEGDDQPRERLARPVAELVYGVDETLGFHRTRKYTSHSLSNGWLASCTRITESLALLGSRSGGLGSRLGEVVIIGHAPAYIGIEVPLHRALGEGALRYRNFFEQGILSRFFRLHLIEDLKLLLQHRIRRPVKPYLISG